MLTHSLPVSFLSFYTYHLWFEGNTWILGWCFYFRTFCLFQVKVLGIEGVINYIFSLQNALVDPPTSPGYVFEVSVFEEKIVLKWGTDPVKLGSHMKRTIHRKKADKVKIGETYAKSLGVSFWLQFPFKTFHHALSPKRNIQYFIIPTVKREKHSVHNRYIL